MMDANTDLFHVADNHVVLLADNPDVVDSLVHQDGQDIQDDLRNQVVLQDERPDDRLPDGHLVKDGPVDDQATEAMQLAVAYDQAAVDDQVVIAAVGAVDQVPRAYVVVVAVCRAELVVVPETALVALVVVVVAHLVAAAVVQVIAFVVVNLGFDAG